MRIQIIGVGVVGEAQAYLMSHLGHEVLGLDRKGSTSTHYRTIKRLAKDVDMTFVCTPEAAVPEVVGDLVRENVRGLHVIKSTVPPGTTRELSEKHGVHISHNPEFLREKTAFRDVANPNVIVVGQCCAVHGTLLRDLYAPLGCPTVITQPATSEITKISLNSYLATLITFWNEIDSLAKRAGVKTEDVASLVKYDPRVSVYGTEFFGAPFGGKCLPKDLNQAIQFGRRLGLPPAFLEAVRDFNTRLGGPTAG